MGFLCDQTTDERVHVDLFIIRSSRSYFSIFTSSRFFNQTFPRSFAKEKIMSRMLKQNIQAINVRLSNTHTCPHVPARICSRKAYNWVNQQGNSSDCAWERETERERNYLQLNFLLFFICMVPSINRAVEMSKAVTWLKGDPAYA